LLLADKVKLSGDVTRHRDRTDKPGLLQVSFIKTGFAGRRHPHADLRRPAAAAPQWAVLDAQTAGNPGFPVQLQLGERFDDKLFERHRPAYQGWQTSARSLSDRAEPIVRMML